MRSYLNIYLVPKRKDKAKEKKQYLLFASYSKSTDVYKVFSEYINPAFIYSNNGKICHSTLTKPDVQLMLDGILTGIRKAQERLEVYEQYAPKNEDYIQEIINLREGIQDYKSSHEFISLLHDIISGIVDGYTDFEEICCNVD